MFDCAYTRILGGIVNITKLINYVNLCIISYMIELNTSDDERYVCCVFYATDFDDPEGIEAFFQQNHLMRRETGKLDPDDMSEIMDVAKDRVNEGTHAYFLLWDKHEQQAAGAALLSNMQSPDGYATFTASYVAQKYRGLGLSKLLHQGHVKHLQESGCLGTRSTISETNIPAIQAALRQGFVKVDSNLSEAGIKIGTYELTLSDLEPKPNSGLDI
jgi:L-amino acid N-acyltransferase YncA